MDRAEKYININEAAAILEVTAATVKNWLRLGRLRGGDGLVLVSDAEALKESHLLQSRRNKSNLTAAAPCSHYVKGHTELKKLLRNGLGESELPVLLAEAALRAVSSGVDRLDAFLSGGLNFGGEKLIHDLLGEARPTESTKKITSAQWEAGDGGDTLGLIYMSLLPLNRRRALGAYYTGARIARMAVERLGLKGPVFDPCCGSGSFLLATAEALGSPLGLYGTDIDPTAVRLARLNLYIRYPEYGTEYLYESIREQSFFDEKRHWNAIIGNPPWGGRPERSGAFLTHALGLLNEGGRLAFVLPQSLLTTKMHAPVRRELLERARLVSADYLKTDGFDGVYCPSVLLTAEKCSRPGLGGCVVNSEFTIGRREPDLRCLNLDVTDEEYGLLTKMRRTKNAVYLKGNAVFALGIVTGGNGGVISNSSGRPLIRGTDISPFEIREPSAFLTCDVTRCQQWAPAEVYSAPEKIVYRFIGKRPVFAVDRQGRLTLNSCNIIIPRIEGLDTDYLTAVLNSSAVGFFLEKSFAARKWLRWMLEEVPIPMAPLPLQREIAASDDWDERIGELYGVAINNGRSDILS